MARVAKDSNTVIYSTSVYSSVKLCFEFNVDHGQHLHAKFSILFLKLIESLTFLLANFAIQYAFSFIELASIAALQLIQCFRNNVPISKPLLCMQLLSFAYFSASVFRQWEECNSSS